LTLSRQQAALLRQYAWPGNVRELKNVIERAVILSTGKVLRLDLAMADILAEARPAEVEAKSGPDRILTEAEVRELERRNMQRALEASHGRVSGEGGAAAILGIPATTFADRMKKFKIARGPAGVE
jgi:DNA-binding NtrC family response regulator